MNFITKYFVKRKLKGWEKENMDKIKKVVAWLNEKPGRKRTLAAVLLAGAAALRAFGHTEWADQVSSVNDLVQTWLVSGFDIAGVLTLVVGVKDAKNKGNL